jgi:hypothetical protein
MDSGAFMNRDYLVSLEQKLLEQFLTDNSAYSHYVQKELFQEKSYIEVSVMESVVKRYDAVEYNVCVPNELSIHNGLNTLRHNIISKIPDDCTVIFRKPIHITHNIAYDSFGQLTQNDYVLSASIIVIPNKDLKNRVTVADNVDNTEEYIYKNT